MFSDTDYTDYGFNELYCILSTPPQIGLKWQKEAPEGGPNSLPLQYFTITLACPIWS